MSEADPGGWLRVLAYVHPAWMVVSLALVGLALRSGLALRRTRRGRGGRTPGMRARHLRLAKPAVALVLAGFVLGPLSAVWLRGMDPFATFHAWAGVLAATLFAATAAVGHRIEEGHSRAYDAHALLAAAACLTAALTAIAGFILLP